MKPVVPPQFCPLCGARVEVVRHIINNLFELLCEKCERPCVVHSDDHVLLPGVA